MRLNSGFSIVELTVVLLISGALAAVAVPINSNSETKAKMSEADVALRTIRTQLRIYFNENGAFPSTESSKYVIGASWHEIKSGELTGKYFNDYSYVIEFTEDNYLITCVTGDILPSNLTMNASGKLMGGL
ncbi:MAG: type II secretion system GspH family protein [Candidatus Marinimicrobia bacterium]|nr:type II secretion system GspH family protein [Candidatus Neomarinimicrobiota bacterium]